MRFLSFKKHNPAVEDEVVLLQTQEEVDHFFTENEGKPFKGFEIRNTGTEPIIIGELRIGG